MKQRFSKLLVTSLILIVVTTAFSACDSDREVKETAAVNTTESSISTTNVITTEKATSKTEDEPMLTETTNMVLTVSCDSTNDSGKLLTVCAAPSAGGQNQSPAVSFNEIAGAKSYAIYMIDTSAGNWMHWRAYNVVGTSLTQGETLTNSEYKGPYPPSGSHNYVIYVFALKNDADSYPGNFDSKNSDILTIKSKLDISGGKSGNVLAFGSVKTIYAHGDNNV